jgi:hypothetical protein
MFELTQHRTSSTVVGALTTAFKPFGTEALYIRILVVATFVGQKPDSYDRPHSLPMKFETHC